MNKLFKIFTSSLAHFLCCLIGLFSLVGLAIFIILSLPTCLYRWILCKVLAPLFRRDLGKAVTLHGSTVASELIGNGSKNPPRCAIVTSCTVEGTLTIETLKELVHRRWITAESPNGGLFYPEFQQSVTSWMGYTFWRQDKAFTLDNHLACHKCEIGWSEAECEEFARSLVEELLNKPFSEGKSPWEIHLICGYRNSGILPGGGVMTTAVFRFHHCLADGFSIFYAICEGLLGVPLAECGIATATPAKSRLDSDSSYLGQLANYAGFPIRVLRDFGYVASITVNPIRTPWYIQDEKKSRKQLYERSGLISIGKIKVVKNTFGVSFTTVLLACIGAGVVKAFKGKKVPGKKLELERLPIVIPVPLGGHPTKLRNHVSGAVVDISTDPELSPLQRLEESDRYFQKAKRSTYPLLLPIIIKLAASHIAPLSGFLLKNRTVSIGLTNFPGAMIPVKNQGFNVLAKDFAAGLVTGVAGAGFMIISYCDHIRIAAVAESAAMDRSELRRMIADICNEIENLYELALERKFVQINE